MLIEPDVKDNNPLSIKRRFFWISKKSRTQGKIENSLAYQLIVAAPTLLEYFQNGLNSKTINQSFNWKYIFLLYLGIFIGLIRYLSRQSAGGERHQQNLTDL